MRAYAESSEVDEKGFTHLRLHGPEGGISLVVMPSSTDGIDAEGILTIHYLPDHFYLAPPACEGAQPQECPDFGGLCFPVNAFRAGHEAAGYLTRGHQNHAWGVMRDWYRSSFTPWEDQ